MSNIEIDCDGKIFRKSSKFRRDFSPQILTLKRRRKFGNKKANLDTMANTVGFSKINSPFQTVLKRTFARRERERENVKNRNRWRMSILSLERCKSMEADKIRLIRIVCEITRWLVACPPRKKISRKWADRRSRKER